MSELSRTILRIVLVLAAYAAFEHWMFNAAELRPRDYEQKSITISLVRNVPFELAVILVTGALLSVLRGLHGTWKQLEFSGSIRLVVSVIAVIMAWSYSTYGFNYYFGQLHAADRLVLVLLGALVLWRPMFTLPFSLLLFAMIHQLDQPLHTFLWAVDILMIRIMILLGAALVVSRTTGWRTVGEFVLIGSCLIASNYWWPGVGKLKLAWITHGHLYYLPLAAYTHGWLSFLSPETMVNYSTCLSWFDWPMRIATITLECGALVCFWRRRLFLAFLIGWSAFHVGVFAMLGYFFWEWILMYICWGVMLIKTRNDETSRIFSPVYFVASILLILGTPIWFRPTAQLAWYDTRVSATFEIEGVGASGQVYRLPPRFFAPYEDQMTMGLFGRLNDRPQLVGPYGVTKERAVADALVNATTLEEVEIIEARLGRERLDAEYGREFDEFVRRYVVGHNRDSSRGTWLQFIRPPSFLWSFPKGSVYRGQEPIVKVRLMHRTALFDDQSYRLVRTRQLREISLDRSAEEDAGLTSPLPQGRK